MEKEDLFDLNDYEDMQLPSQETTPSKPKNEIADKNTLETAPPVIITNALNTIQQSSSSISNQEVPINSVSQIKEEAKIEPEQKEVNFLEALFTSTDEPSAIEDNIDVEEYNKIPNKALTYPFVLDAFQKRSIIRLERHENVLACAHTSSGKTVIAEYGIALGKQNKRRVLYTSPIKALSNQKYRDFKKRFGDVGILTGDVSINPDAQCLIMTTEILQNSLYKNSELLNSVEWVVFDEVHYINDNERGHVWEEILILLPSQIGIIMLSATVPNYMEFAKWVGRIKKTTIYVQNTLKRIVPLEHSMFVDSYNVFLAKGSNNDVYENNVRQALKAVHTKMTHEKYRFKNEKFFYEAKQKKENEYYNNIKWFDQYRKKNNGKGAGKGKGNNNFLKITNMHHKIDEIVNYLFKFQYTPAVIFVFSIKRINEYAKMLSLLTLVNKTQSYRITTFFDQCIKTLSEEDRRIPQVTELRMLVQNGIGMHHAGLLPILKEIIEVLYSKGLIKILFATTSFSIGLNMPTRTVVFTEIYKFNEERKVILTSSEYLQMCGRAGRRGIDTIGNVFLLLTEKNTQNDEEDIVSMLKGSGTEVESRFRLCYRTIISFFSRNIKNINEFFKESFLENMNLEQIPVIMKEIEEIKKRLEKIPKIGCKYINDDTYINEHMTLLHDLLLVNGEFFQHPILVKKLKSGRFIQVKDTEFQKNMIVCVIFHYVKYDGELWCLRATKENKKIKYESNEETYTETKGMLNGIRWEYVIYAVEDIVNIYDNEFEIKPIPPRTEGEYHFLTESDTRNLTKKLNYLNNVNDTECKVVRYDKVIKNELKYVELIKRKEELLVKISQSKCSKCPFLPEHYKTYDNVRDLNRELLNKQKFLNPENLAHYNEFTTRLTILKKMGYIDDNQILTLKGKAAREIATTDCVMITELLLSNILEPLTESEVIGYLSGFACNKSDIEFDDPGISTKFSKAIKDFEEIYESIIQTEDSVDHFQDNKYNRRLTFSISKAMKSWMDGNRFVDILKETDLEEGKLYNLIMRIYLFLEEIINFYSAIGNVTFSNKFNEIKRKLMRGIMSTQSLYLQDEINIDIKQEE